MIFTSNILTAALVFFFVYLPSASALPAISSYSETEARSISNLAPTTNAKSNSAWALDRRSTIKTYTGKPANQKTLSNTNTYKKMATGGTPPKAKPKVQSKSNRGANGRPPARQQVMPANNVKRPNGVRPPSGRVPPPSRKMPTNNLKGPTGHVDPSQVKGLKPKNIGKVFENPHHGNKSPIYAMSFGQSRYEEPEESSENDDE